MQQKKLLQSYSFLTAVRFFSHNIRSHALSFTLLLLFLCLINQTHQVLEFLDAMFGVLLVAFVAVGGKLLEPGTNVLFRDVVPLGVGLQAQVDTHLWVLLFAYGQLHGLGRASIGTIPLIFSHGSRQGCLRVQFLIESFNLSSFEK